MERLVIPAAQVPQNPLRCPSCKSPDIILDGMVGRHLHEVRRDGEMVKEESHVSNDIEMDVTLLTCPACKVEYYVQNDYEVDLARHNLDLELELAQMKGTIPPPGKYVC